ncbi:MAG: hypothetical protein ACU843_10610 [Gammaproteobacteria bacterium]
MANTERMKVIQQVRAAKKEANAKRFDQSLSPESRAIMERLYSQLDDVEDELIMEEITARVEQLKRASSNLSAINREMAAAADNIAEFAAKVGQVADAIKILVDISVAAAGIA